MRRLEHRDCEIEEKQRQSLGAEFAKGAKFRKGRTGNDERDVRDVFSMCAMEERATGTELLAQCCDGGAGFDRG